MDTKPSKRRYIKWTVLFKQTFFFYTSAVMVMLGGGEVRCVILTKKLIIYVAMSRDGMILKAKVG